MISARDVTGRSRRSGGGPGDGIGAVTPSALVISPLSIHADSPTAAATARPQPDRSRGSPRAPGSPAALPQAGPPLIQRSGRPARFRQPERGQTARSGSASATVKPRGRPLRARC